MQVLLLLLPALLGTSALVRAQNDGDSSDESVFGGAPESGGEEAGPDAGGDSGPDMDAQAAAQQRALRSADQQHSIMKQFLHNFADNMKLSVLADSEGDMPEQERQQMIRKLRAEHARGGMAMGEPRQPMMRRAPMEEEQEEEQAPDNAEEEPRSLMRRPPQEAEEEMEQPTVMRRLPQREEAEDEGAPDAFNPPMPPRRHSRMRMLNAAPRDDLPAPSAPPRRHRARMLNSPTSAVQRQTQRRHKRHEPAAGEPTTVVRDSMGRPMPLLFGGAKHHSKSGASALVPCSCLVYLVGFALAFLSS